MSCVARGEATSVCKRAVRQIIHTGFDEIKKRNTTMWFVRLTIHKKYTDTLGVLWVCVALGVSLRVWGRAVTGVRWLSRGG